MIYYIEVILADFLIWGNKTDEANGAKETRAQININASEK